MTIQLTSTAFAEGEPIPKVYTKGGGDIPPPLQWSGVPDGTKAFAVICDDPDAPSGTWVHWVIFNIPGDARGLDEGVPTDKELPSGAKQGRNDFKDIGYGGPKPPPGKPHRYFFRLYALDGELNLAAGATKQQLVDAVKGHTLAQGQLMGTHQR